MHSATGFGYTSHALVGQSLLTISPPEQRPLLLHSLQVLAQMDEIARLTGISHRQAIRVLHRALVGVGQPGSTPELVVHDSTITIGETGRAGHEAPPTTCIVRSRRATGPDSRGGFQMLPSGSKNGQGQPVFCQGA